MHCAELWIFVPHKELLLQRTFIPGNWCFTGFSLLGTFTSYQFILSVSRFVYYILLVFYLYCILYFYVSCNSVRMSHWNKRLLTYLNWRNFTHLTPNGVSMHPRPYGWAPQSHRYATASHKSNPIDVGDSSCLHCIYTRRRCCDLWASVLVLLVTLSHQRLIHLQKPSLDVAPTTLATFSSCGVNSDLWSWPSNLIYAVSGCTSLQSI